MTRWIALSLGTLALLVSQAEAEVLARFRGDFTEVEPPAGWQYLWNAEGEMGLAAAYAPLAWSDDARAFTAGKGKLPQPQPAAFLALRGTGGHPGRGAKQAPNTADRYVIAAYTIPAGKAGIAWVSDGEILRGPIPGSETTTVAQTVQLRVYLNDDLKHTATINANAEPTPFVVNLGHVTGGETVYVAVGPDGHDINDGFGFDFRVAVLPAGEQPQATPSLSIVPEDPGKPSLRRDKRGEPDPKFMTAHEEMLSRLRKTPEAQVVFLGDSIMAGWAHAGRSVWDRQFASLKPLNLGVAGDQTQHVLWRIDNGELEGLTPRVVVLLIGTNNTGRYGGIEIAHGVEAVVKRLREKLPNATIVLTGIFPRSEKPTDQVRAKVKLANDRIAQLADGRAVHYVDIADKLLQPDGTISRDLMPDFLHLTTPAYQAWADAILPLIESSISRK